MAPAPHCFCGNPSKRGDLEYFCAQNQCPYRCRVASGSARRTRTPRSPRAPRNAFPSGGRRPRQAPQAAAGERCTCGEPVERISTPGGSSARRQYVRCRRPIQQRCKYFRLVTSAQPEPARHDLRAIPVPPTRRSNGAMPVPFFQDGAGRPGTGSSTASRPDNNGNSRPPSAGSATMVGADRHGAAGGAGFGHGAGEQPGEDPEAPQCRCGVAAVQRTVKKEGRNKGKQFFVCAQPQGSQCGYFEWADKVLPSGPSARQPMEQKRAAETANGNDHSPTAQKRPRYSSRSQINLELDGIHKITFRLNLSSPDDLKTAVKSFEGVTFKKTDFLGVEQGAFPIEKAFAFARYVEANAATTVNFNVPHSLIERILQYRHAEIRREEQGDVVTTPLDEILPTKLCESLMEFQWHGVHFALKRGGRCLIGDDMGLGKTLQAIAVARVYVEDWPLLIICPSSLRLNWKEELLRWLVDDLQEEDIRVIMNGKDIDMPLLRVNIVSYDLMRKMPPNFVKRCKFIIADESHYLKSTTAQRSKAVTPLIKNAKRALLLSGTPALSRPVELFPQINAISPILFPRYQEYVERYCAAHVGRFGYDVSGASNLDELHMLLRGSVLIRRKKEEVLTQLPEKQRQVLWVQTKPKLMKDVASATTKLEKAKARLRSVRDERQAAAIHNEVRSAQNELYTATGLAKLDSVKEFCKDTAETGCKFIVFAHHKEVVDQLQEYLQGKLKLGIIQIDGNTPQGNRQMLCKKFQEDARCRVALLSITAAGVGLTLTKATVVLFSELYWNPGSLLQAEDRAHRIGQRDCVLVKYLLAKKTIDESMWSTVRRKLTVVGHSLTGAAARMDVTEDRNPDEAPPGSIGSFFKAKPRGTQAPNGSTQLDDAIIEIDDDEVTQTVQASASEQIHTQKPNVSTDDIMFPTSLDENEPDFKMSAVSDKALRNGSLDDAEVITIGSDTEVDFAAARRMQEQIDADVALARKLQAEFDAED